MWLQIVIVRFSFHSLVYLEFSFSVIVYSSVMSDVLRTPCIHCVKVYLGSVSDTTEKHELTSCWNKTWRLQQRRVNQVTVGGSEPRLQTRRHPYRAHCPHCPHCPPQSCWQQEPRWVKDKHEHAGSNELVLCARFPLLGQKFEGFFFWVFHTQLLK